MTGQADAEALARAGWPVFPTREKRPLTPDGFKSASTDPIRIGSLWQTNPDAQIAIAVPEGRVVVDVDTPDATHPYDGFETLRALEARHGALPLTLTSVSGRGGEHRWYTLPAGTPPLVQRDLGPGIQTRVGGKGYVVAPPSIHHETGKAYTWRHAPMAEAPPWLVEALLERSAPTPTLDGWPVPSSDALTAARSWLATAPPSIQGQNGSGALMRAAGVLVRGFALGPELGGELLREYNDTKAQPPWTLYELGRAIEGASSSGREPAVGSMLPDVDLFRAITAPRLGRYAPEVLGVDDIFSPLPDVDYLVHGLGIAPGAPAMIAGYGYSGKTAAVQQLVIDLTRAEHAGDWMNPRPVWGKFRGGKRARVLHVDYEQGRTLTSRRYQRLAQAAGLDQGELRGYLRLVALPSFYLNTREGYDTLDRLCEGVDLLVIDSYRAASPGTDENSSDAREPLDALTRLSEAHGFASIVIHHARKPNRENTGGTKMSIRGSGALFDGCSSVLVFEGEKDQPKRVSHEKERHCGITADDFDLVIEDVEGGGFRVRATEVTVVSAKERGLEELRADMTLIREWLKENLYFKNLNQISKAVGIRRERASAAMGALETTGELIQDGSYRDRSYHLTGKNTP